jgi:hypothetical protein
MTMSDYSTVTAGRSVAKATESDVALLGAMFWTVAGVVLCYVLSPSRDGVEWLVALHAGNAAALMWYWKFSRWEGGKFLSFGGLSVLAGALFRLISIVDTVTYGLRLENWPPTVSELAFEQSVIRGEVISVAGLLLVVIGWRYALRWHLPQANVAAGSATGGVESLVFWLLSLGVLATGGVFQKVGASFGTLLPSVFLLGSSSVAFLPIMSRTTGVSRALLALLMGLPFAALGMRSGMKSEIFLPLLPGAVFAWGALRNPLARGVMIAVATALLVLSQGYVHFVRLTTWNSKIELPVSTLVDAYLRQIESSRTTALLASAEGMSSRVNLTGTHAITVGLTEQNGFLPDRVFLPIPLVFVPRILWPDKPAFAPGAEQTARITGRGSAASATSSTAAGFFTEMYMGGGVLGLVLASLAYGLLSGVLQRALISGGSSEVNKIYALVLLQQAVRLDESTPVTAYAAVVTVFLVAITISKTAAQLFPAQARGRSARATSAPLPAV